MNKKIFSLAGLIVGIVFVIVGIYGLCTVYSNVARENIVTPADASIPNTPVRGPFTLFSQVEVIRHHTLAMTGGKTFAEMPRQIPSVNAAGNPIIGDDGKPVMVANTARDIWITATTLTTALNMAILSYVIFTVILVFGILMILGKVVKGTVRK